MDKLLSAFDRSFISLDTRSRQLLAKLPENKLFLKPREIANSMAIFSCGEYILRSAAMVEKTFGGITTRLWDDPFEWTLPEKLFDRNAVFAYLDEVEKTRVLGFSYFKSDDDLLREMPSPERLRPIIDILLEAIGKAEHFQGRAFAVFQMISDEKPPRM
ncbi:MAG: hypothetical protein ABIV48_07050 [Pyrinomonadaceae bacterium]